MDKYHLFYKRRMRGHAKFGLECDVLISAFNSSERVQLVSQHVNARKLHWLILPEYGYARAEYPTTGTVYDAPAENEADFLSNFLAQFPGVENLSIAIDITGFVNHYVLVLLDLLRRAGVRHCYVLYGEPLRYMQSERTKFSDEAVLAVRQVSGYEGVHTTETGNDLLLMAVGYDYRLVSEVANYKDHASKLQLFGLPSLRPDMFQESLLQAYNVKEAVGSDASHPPHFKFAPAYDPFVTASIISLLVGAHRKQHPRANVYLSPLSTKAQTLGFAVFYLAECQQEPVSVLYPLCQRYMRETSQGLSGAWLYEVELEHLSDGSLN
jgi:hypothetical protein